jgi:hypothetical protein
MGFLSHDFKKNKSVERGGDIIPEISIFDITNSVYTDCKLKTK